MTDTKRPLRVFLCHASNDEPVVIKLYERLVEDGIDAWLNTEKLLPGQNWRIEIHKAVKNSDVVIVCLSSKSVTKEGYVQTEIKLALDAADEKPDETIFIIPARLDDCKVPERISQYHWVDLFSENGYERLLKALEIRANTVGAVFELSQEESIHDDNDLWDEEIEDEEIEVEDWNERFFLDGYPVDLRIAENRKKDISKQIDELIINRNKLDKENDEHLGKALIDTGVQAFFSILFIGAPVFIIAMITFDVSNLSVSLCSAGGLLLIIFFIFARVLLKRIEKNRVSTEHIDTEIQKLQKELKPLNRYIYSFNKTKRSFNEYQQNKKDLQHLTNNGE
jgi:hypothetical protein